MGKQHPRPQESWAASSDANHGTTTLTPQRPLQPPPVQDTLLKILEASEDSKNTLRQEIGKVSVELGLLRTDHRKLVGRVDNVEDWLTEMGTSHQAPQTQLAQLTDRVQRLENRAEDTEGRSRRNKKMQASQGKQAAIQATASLTVSPSADKDKPSHTDMGESGDSSDYESVVDPRCGLPHVTSQTAEDII
ncbi:hypothetical protein NDU88_004259 [Pleurodeles waltl]|uniref:Uncharacterized protein n=1 Tax=Pleurodeles waltl TaxID=8319 RepID=A0AAV7W8I8_PLEWA|nr:hypothetical protein NDU88_004259 [Pleurodeles waltl]